MRITEARFPWGEATAIMRNSQRGNILLSPHIQFFKEATPTAIERVVTDLPVSRRAYEGEYYAQEGPTCLPWGLANGLRRVGIEVDLKGMTGVHGYGVSAAAKYRSEHYIEVIARTMRAFHPDAVLDFSPEQKLYNPLDVGPVWGDPRERSISVTDFMDGVRRNAEGVKSAIDAEKAYVISVRTGEYRNTSSDTAHAIVIAGYDVTEDGYMDTQVVDSQDGIYWTTIEHITATLDYFCCTVAKKE